ncbi:MAG: beta-galactosidase [Verrucomicrobiota bacterium]
MMRSTVRTGLALASVVGFWSSGFAGDQALFKFNSNFDLSRIRTSDARAALVTANSDTVLRIQTGHEKPWPGVTVPSPNGHWDLSAFGRVEVSLHNTGTNHVTVYCRVDNPGADGIKNCVTESLRLQPGQVGRLKVPLPRASSSTLDGKLFGMRGYPVAPGGAGTLDVTNITQLLLFVSKPTEDHQFEVGDISATGEFTPPTAWVTDANPFFPFIDMFGQYKHKDWPGKVHSLAELQRRREAEAKELVDNSCPADWDKYGGWADGPQLKPTGFFRTEKVNGKWWLVNPDGHLFWSHGIDCVRMLDATPIEERATWFEDFVGDQPDFRDLVSSPYALKGHYADRSPKSFSFAGANLKRKYGENWRSNYAGIIHQRLRSWGLNTIANWSDSAVFLMRRTPFTDNVGSHGVKMVEGSEGYWGKFPDVFDPGFAAAMRRAMEAKQKTSANDPWCIGYFSDNEMSWGDELSLALGALKSPATQAAKQEFVADLKAKYGDISKLNAAWGAMNSSWDELLASRVPPDPKTAREDLFTFSTKMAETYFRTVRDAIKAVAPNQLYLGCRFAWVNDLAVRAAAKYCDVVSFNLYRRDISDFDYPGEEKPFLVGEFHFGALDRGMFHTGLVPVENQAARAQAYRDYVLGALRHPRCVGTHWFQWQDEPTTGRVYDEENYQIGFIDVADTPYAETISASREVGGRLYRRP